MGTRMTRQVDDGGGDGVDGDDADVDGAADDDHHHDDDADDHGEYDHNDGDDYKDDDVMMRHIRLMIFCKYLHMLRVPKHPGCPRVGICMKNP